MTPEQLRLAILIAGYFVVVILFYIFVVKPRRDAMKRHRDLVQSLAAGDEIVTAGGIHGRIVTVHDKTCVVEVGKDMRMTLERGAVRARQEESS